MEEFVNGQDVRKISAVVAETASIPQSVYDFRIHLAVLCHFVDHSGACTGGTDTATLHGKTVDGVLFRGTDKLCLVPN